MKYVVKKTTYYNGENRGDTYLTKNFSSKDITNLMKKYPFTSYEMAHQFILESQYFDYQATIKYHKEFRFEYEIIEI